MKNQVNERTYFLSPQGPIILFLILFIMISGTGCQKSPETAPVCTPEENQEQKNIKYGEITDPVELDKLWQEYFYDSIATVANARDFDSPQEIDSLYVARFCGFKYAAEHGSNGLKPLEEGSSFKLLPLDIVLEYAKRYFDLSSLDVSKIDEGTYDQEEQAFIFFFENEQKRPTYNESNAWGEKLDKIIRNNDGSVTAVFLRYGNPGTRIEMTRTLTLQQREDGSLYFSKGRWEYVNNNLVVLDGAYERFDALTGYGGNMEELAMLGEVDGKMLLAATPYEKGSKPSLLLIDPDSMSVEKRLDFNESFSAADIRIKGEKIIAFLNDKILSIDKSLEQLEQLEIPALIREKIKRESKYDQNGMPDVVFGGYDSTGDLGKFVYSDETGVKFLDLAEGNEKMLTKTVHIPGGELIDVSYHWSPRFVANDTKVITTMTGYESTMGYTLCNLQEDSEKLYNITAECSSTANIRYDSGRLEVNTHVYNHETQSGECKTFYLDFTSGEVRDIKLNNPRETGDIRFPELCFVGQDYAAFITYEYDYTDNANNKHFINRLNLKTFEEESDIVSVKAAETRILGVLADGRIVFWYNLNPSEKGICITK